MKTICLLNFLALMLVLACNFEMSDLPYFKGAIQNIYGNSTKIIAQKITGLAEWKVLTFFV
jgi:hypothetical protein